MLCQEMTLYWAWKLGFARLLGENIKRTKLKNGAWNYVEEQLL